MTAMLTSPNKSSGGYMHGYSTDPNKSSGGVLHGQSSSDRTAPLLEKSDPELDLYLPPSRLRNMVSDQVLEESFREKLQVYPPLPPAPRTNSPARVALRRAPPPTQVPRHGCPNKPQRWQLSRWCRGGRVLPWGSATTSGCNQKSQSPSARRVECENPA